MPNEVSVQREIHAPAETLWAMIADVSRMGEWSPETVGCHWLKPSTGPKVGARFKGNNRVGAKKWSTICKVTEAEPGKVFAFTVDVGPIGVAQWTYRFEPTDEGCRVTETWNDRRNGLIKRLGKPVSGVSDRETHNRAGMEVTLERLAQAAESTDANNAD